MRAPAAQGLRVSPTPAFRFATATRKLQNRRRYRKHRTGPVLASLQSPDRREVRVQSLRDLRRMFDLSSSSASSGDEAAAPASGLARRAILDDSTTVIPQGRRRAGALFSRGSRKGDSAAGSRSTASLPVKYSGAGWAGERAPSAQQGRAPPLPPPSRRSKDSRRGRRPVALLPTSAAPQRVRPVSRLPASLRAPKAQPAAQSERRVHFASTVEEFGFAPDRTLFGSASEPGGEHSGGDDAGADALTDEGPPIFEEIVPPARKGNQRGDAERVSRGVGAAPEGAYALSGAARPQHGPSAVDRLLQDIDSLCVSDEDSGTGKAGRKGAVLSAAEARAEEEDEESDGRDYVACAAAPAVVIPAPAAASGSRGKRLPDRQARERGAIKRRPTPARSALNGWPAAQGLGSNSDLDAVLETDSESQSESDSELLGRKPEVGVLDSMGATAPTRLSGGGDPVVIAAADEPAILHPDFDFEEEGEEEEEEEEVEEEGWTGRRGSTIGDSRDWGSGIFAPSRGSLASVAAGAAPAEGAQLALQRRATPSDGRDTECLHFGQDGRLQTYSLAELRAKAGKCVRHHPPLGQHHTYSRW